MRTKDEILHSLKILEINPDIISTSEHQRAEILTEVLIDIRDTLFSRLDRDQETFFMKWNKG